MPTLKEAAARLGLSPDTLRSQIRYGRLKARKVGRDWHVTEREMERYRLASLGPRRLGEARCIICGVHAPEHKPGSESGHRLRTPNDIQIASHATDSHAAS